MHCPGRSLLSSSPASSPGLASTTTAAIIDSAAGNATFLVAAASAYMFYAFRNKSTSKATWTMGNMAVRMILTLLLIAIDCARVCLAPAMLYSQEGLLSHGLAVSLFSSCCIFLAFCWELSHNQPFSVIMTTYLVLLSLQDCVRTWLYSSTLALKSVAIVSAVAATMKLALLIVQGPSNDTQETNDAAPKEDANEPASKAEDKKKPFSLSWINSTLFFGFQNVQTLDQLPDLSTDFLCQKLQARFHETWDEADKASANALAWASFAAVRGRMLIAAIPRLLFALFGFGQPWIIERILLHIHDESTASSMTWELIRTTALLYFGKTTVNGITSYLTSHNVMYMRGMLSSEIARKNIRLNSAIAKNAGTITVINNDIESVIKGIKNVHELWVSTLEVATGLYCLSGSVGVACLFALIPIAISIFSSYRIGSRAAEATAQWNQSIEDRVSQMTTILNQMKGIKMTTVETVIMKCMSKMRSLEIRQSRLLRLLLVNRITLVPLNAIFTPAGVITCGLLLNGFASISTIELYKILAYLIFLSEPMYSILRCWTHMGMMIAGFARIQSFLLLEEKHDSRLLRRFDRYGGQQVQLAHRHVGDRCIALLDASVVSTTVDGYVLQNMQLNILTGTLSMVAGPVASGKSTFLKTLLGETLLTKGEIHVSNTLFMAFCGETPWFPNTTIVEAIITNLPYVEEWYNIVIDACALAPDIENLTDGDVTTIGKNGETLSGGQKQRIALARAVYSRLPLLVLDDALSAVDVDTTDIIFRKLFHPNGILKRQRRTVIFASHSREYHHLADQVLDIDHEGNVSVRDPKLLQNNYTRPLRGGTDREQPRGDDVIVEQLTEAQTLAFQEIRLSGRQSASNWKLYKLFFRAVSTSDLTFWGFLMAAAVSLERSPAIYISTWLLSAPENMNWAAGLFFIGFLSLLVNRSASALFLLKLTPNIATNLHDVFMDVIIRSILPFLTTTSFGVILSRVSHDMTIISYELPEVFQRLVYSIILVSLEIVVITSSIRYAWLLAPLMLAALWKLQGLNIRISRQLRALELQSRTGLFGKLNETVAGLEHIRTFGWDKRILDENLNLVNQSQKSYYYVQFHKLWLKMTMHLMASFIAVLLIAVAIHYPSRTTIPCLGLALVFTMSIALSMEELMNDAVKTDTGLQAVARLKDLIDTTPTEDDLSESQPVPHSWPQSGSIEFTNVSSRHNWTGLPQMALDDVSISIGHRKKYVLRGRTGCGKSSFLLTLLNFLDYTGTIRIDGVDISTIPRARLRSAITTLPQEAVLIPGSVRDNVAPRDLLNIPGRRATTDQEVEDVLEFVGLLEYVNARGDLHSPIEEMEFSAGQEQLLSLARGIMHHAEMKTKIVLLDEATSKMDHQTEMLAQRAITFAFQACTKIVIAHRPAAYDRCDFLVEVQDGAVVAETDVKKWAVVDDEISQAVRSELEAHGVYD